MWWEDECRNEDVRLDSPPQVAAPSMKLSDISGKYVNYYTFQGSYACLVISLCTAGTVTM